MSNLKPTDGEWITGKSTVLSDDLFVQSKHNTVCRTNPADFSTDEEAEANAIIIADAGTTFNKCGKLSSELLADNEELKEALKQSVNLLTSIQGEGFKEWIEYKTWSDLLTKYNNQ